MENTVHIEGERVGTTFPRVEKLPERKATAFPLLECLRTHYWQHCEPISGQKCTTLQDFASQHCSGDDNPELPQREGGGRPPSLSQANPVHAWTQTTSNFRLARQRSHCSCFTKPPLAENRYVHVLLYTTESDLAVYTL